MKRLTAIILCIVICMSVTAVYADARVTVYAPDGRECAIAQGDVEAWKAVGWYTYPVATVYAPDGRSCTIAKKDVSAWQSVGWYTYPVATVYAPDGRSTVISKNAVSTWQSVGWYTYPVATVYAPDGRSAVIAKSDVPAWVAVGWMDNDTRLRRQYIGVWKQPEYEGNSVTVYKCENGKISFMLFSANARATRVACCVVENVPVVNNSASFSYKDSWGNKGTGVITFSGNTLSLSIKETKTVGMWSVSLAEGVHNKALDYIDASFNPDNYR